MVTTGNLNGHRCTGTPDTSPPLGGIAIRKFQVLIKAAAHPISGGNITRGMPSVSWPNTNENRRDVDMLASLGFGWGMIREYGFHELTVPEFREQLHSYSVWLKSVLGPSLPCVSGQAYRQELPWGKIEASTDWRTELAGIGVHFG